MNMRARGVTLLRNDEELAQTFANFEHQHFVTFFKQKCIIRAITLLPFDTTFLFSSYLNSPSNFPLENV